MSLSTVLFLTGSFGLWGALVSELRLSRSSELSEKSKVVRQQQSRGFSHKHSPSAADSKQNFEGKPNTKNSVSRDSGNAAETQSSSEVRVKRGDRNFWKDLKTWFENQSPLGKCFVIFTVVGLCGAYFVAWLSAWLTDKESSPSKDS